MDPSVKAKTIKFLERNIGEIFLDPGVKTS